MEKEKVDENQHRECFNECLKKCLGTDLNGWITQLIADLIEVKYEEMFKAVMEELKPIINTMYDNLDKLNLNTSKDD